MAVLAVVAVVVIVLAVLVVTGVFGGSGGSSGGTGAPAPFSTSVGPAGNATSSVPGGPWTLVAAVGVGIPVSISGPDLGSVVSGACTFTPAPGSPSTVTFPATPASAPTGELGAWLFTATNASPDTLLLVEVTSGSAVPIAYGTGASCAATFEGFGSIATPGLVDSIEVGATANADGGSAFLANHTVLARLFVLLGPSSISGGVPVWSVQYSTCAFAGGGGNGTEFQALLYATSGAIVTPPTTESVAC